MVFYQCSHQVARPSFLIFLTISFHGSNSLIFFGHDRRPFHKKAWHFVSYNSNYFKLTSLPTHNLNTTTQMTILCAQRSIFNMSSFNKPKPLTFHYWNFKPDKILILLVTSLSLTPPCCQSIVFSKNKNQVLSKNALAREIRNLKQFIQVIDGNPCLYLDSHAESDPNPDICDIVDSSPSSLV